MDTAARSTDAGDDAAAVGIPALMRPRHPWNTEFSWRGPQPPFRVLDAEQAAQFDQEGYVVLGSVFDAEQVQKVTEEIDGYVTEADVFLRSLPDQSYSINAATSVTFAAHLVERSGLLHSVVRHPTLLGLCADLIGPDVNLYWDQAVYKKPEKPRRFPWHQDTGYAFVDPQHYLTCWVALTDASLHNGCPQVVPGVHRSGTLRHHYVEPLGWECFEDPPGRAITAPVPLGGVVVFSSLTPHLTGPNLTDQVRKAYIIQYAPSGARVLQGDPAVGPPTGEQACDDPDRQLPVLRSGVPVEETTHGR